MTNVANEMISAIQNGELQTINNLLDSVLLNEEPDLQYEIADLLMQYGYLNEANRVYEHLQFIFPDEAQLSIDRASVLIELGKRMRL